jgi:transcription elongation GreA/GreB family factor
MAHPHIASPPGPRIAAEAQDRLRDGYGRLRQIEEATSGNSHHRAADLEARRSSPVVQAGSRVIIPGATDSEVEITIVGPYQDGGLHRLSTRFPLAMALIRHRVGDEVKVHTQAGRATFPVVQVDR